MDHLCWEIRLFKKNSIISVKITIIQKQLNDRKPEQYWSHAKKQESIESIY